MLSGDSHDFIRLRDDVDRLVKDIYFGNGKPGITTRIQSLEERVERLEGIMDKVLDKLDGLRKNFWIGIGALMAAEYLLKLYFDAKR